MRRYILTPREREILKTYVQSGVKLNGFSVLALRLKQASKTLFEDIELIKAALKKMEEELEESKSTNTTILTTKSPTQSSPKRIRANPIREHK